MTRSVSHLAIVLALACGTALAAADPTFAEPPPADNPDATPPAEAPPAANPDATAPPVDPDAAVPEGAEPYPQDEGGTDEKGDGTQQPPPTGQDQPD